MGRGVTVAFALAALASLGCSGTKVLTAPHAAPNEAATGLVLNERVGTGYVEKGLVAVTEAKRGDLVWRVQDGGGRIELCHPGGCVEPEPAKGTELPRKQLRFLEPNTVRPASARAGVWVSGGRFLPYVHYCWVEGARPMCVPAQQDGEAVIALVPLSAHAVKKGDRVEDVLWVSVGATVTRCWRSHEHPTCSTATPQ